jgi:ABC-2 type transport system permease protein
MRNALIVAQRELAAIFVQPIVYVFSIVMIVITGLIFADELANYVLSFGGGPPPGVDSVLGLFASLTLFVAPAITMRLLSEEQRSGTVELLMTLPIRDGEVVVGKWLAALVFYVVTLLLTLIYPFILLQFGNPDVGPIVSGYLGILLWGASLLALGLLASALTENQIVAFILGFGINLVLYLGFIVSRSILAGNARLGGIVDEVAMVSHLSSFLSGLITAKDLLYFLVVIAIALFAAARVLESRRWR